MHAEFRIVNVLSPISKILFAKAFDMFTGYPWLRHELSRVSVHRLGGDSTEIGAFGVLEEIVQMGFIGEGARLAVGDFCRVISDSLRGKTGEENS